MKKIMLGNEAIARGVYEAGATVATAYPGTPSTEITEYISSYENIYSEWSPNEKVALEVAIGASYGGARSISSMKHVGLNVAADPLFTVSYTGINGGLIIVVADDPGMHSSQNEQDSRYYALSSKTLMLEPADSQECLDFVKNGFLLSEQFDTPVIIRLTTRVAHSRSIVEITEKENYEIKSFDKNFEKYVMMPAMARKRHIEVEKRIQKLHSFSESSSLNEVIYNDTSIGIITSGISYQLSKEALEDASYLKLGIVYPLPDDLIIEFASKVKKLYVIEELEPYIENHIKKLGIKVEGKSLFPIFGEISSSMIKEKILNEKQSTETLINEHIPIRPPVLCPGCPHRGAFYIFKKLKLNVSGDIGCYTLGALPPLNSMDTCVCMGASVGIAHGMEKAQGRDFSKKTIGVIGDSTFIHSGITGLIDIVYNKGTSTIVILDNSITGMTGHQHNPTTGFTIKNEKTQSIDLVKLCEAIGINRVRVADPFNLSEFEEILSEELSKDEASVIIAKRPCALLKEVKFEGPLKINSSKCKKCKACMLIGCPAIVNDNNNIYINEALCVGCNLCVELCKFDAFEKAGNDNE